MLARRTLLGCAAATSLCWDRAFGQTARETIVMAMQIDDIISLDPAESFESSGTEIGSNCYDRLVDSDQADPAQIKPGLASHWEVAGDGLTHTFYLRQDRKFASGAFVTADDVAWSLQRAAIMNRAPGFILTQFGFDKSNAETRIKTTDDHTLVLQIAEANAPNFLFDCLSATIGSVIDKKLALSHAVDGDLGNGWLKTASAGSNVWAVRLWSAGDSVSLDAVGGSASRPKRMVIRHVAEPAAQLLLLQKGEADIARNLGSEQLKAIKDKPEFTLGTKARASVNYVAMNQSMPELAHPDVVQAVKWAIDYDAIETTITPDTSKTHQAFLPEGVPGALTGNPFRKDVDKAKALMKLAGLEKGFSVTLDHPAAPPFGVIGQAMQADLAAIGIQVRLAPADFAQVIAKTRARQHQMAMMRWDSDYLDPHANAQTFCINVDNTDASTRRTVAWCSGWQDQDLSGRALDAVKEVDATKRIAQYEQLQKDFMQRAPFAIFQQQIGIVAMRKPVSGLELGAVPAGTRYGDLAKA